MNIYQVLDTLCRDCGNLICENSSTCNNSEQTEHASTSNFVQQNSQNQTSNFDSSDFAPDDVNSSANEFHNYRTVTNLSPFHKMYPLHVLKTITKPSYTLQSEASILQILI